MQKLFTISALLIMLLLQYSRQAAYLHCKMENISVGANCDCEKIMQQADDDHQNDDHAIFKAASPDEFFYLSRIAQTPSTEITGHYKPTASLQHFHSQLFISLLIQPPIS